MCQSNTNVMRIIKSVRYNIVFEHLTKPIKIYQLKIIIKKQIIYWGEITQLEKKVPVITKIV